MGRNAESQLRAVAPEERAASDVTLTLAAHPSNVAVIRRLLCALAEALRLPDALVEDLRLAVTEACTNVVRHAYPPERPGPVEISVRAAEDQVSVVVSDRGRGIGTSADTTGPGLGLPLIAAIADEVQLKSVPGGGSRVAMTFAHRGDAA
jgi:serine/threonine-protein kinase RsbW